MFPHIEEVQSLIFQICLVACEAPFCSHLFITVKTPLKMDARIKYLTF